MVTNQLEIGRPEAVYILHFWVHLEDRKWTRRALQLRLKRFDMVLVDVSVAKRVNELTRLQTTNLGDHQREQRVR